MKAKHLKNIFTFLPILLTIVLSSTIYAQTWTQRGGDICGEAISDFSGWSIALNSDGTKLAVGAAKNQGGGNNRGHVRVFGWDGAVWGQLGNDIDGDDLIYFETIVSGDASGDIIDNILTVTPATNFFG